MDVTQDLGAQPRRSLSRRFRLVVAGLVLARGLMALCSTPLFEGWDEYQHVAYIVHIQETGRRAILNETLVPSSAMAAMASFPQPEAARVQFPLASKPPSYASFWAGSSRTPAPSPSEIPPHDVRLYQAQHSWWYYVLVSPLFRILGGLDDLTTSVAGLRLLNLAFTVGAVWIALGVVSVRVSDRRTAGWIALLIGVQPLIVMNGVRVSSDASGMFFATAAVAQMLRLATDDRKLLGRSCVVGLLVGAAVVLKATNLALFPAVGIAWLMAIARVRPSATSALASGMAMGAIVGLLMAPDLAHNLAVYGVATPMQEAIENRAKGRGPAELLHALWAFPFVRYGRWLFGEGLFIQGNWSFILPIDAVTKLHWSILEWAGLGLVVSAAAFGIRKLFGRAGDRAVTPVDSLATVLLCVVVCGGYFSALLYHAVQSALAWGVTTTGPWYASPSLPWFLLLVGAGARGWPRFVGVALVSALVLLGLTAEQTSRWVQMLPIYSGGAEGLEALRRVTSNQPWFLAMATFALATVAGLALLAAAIRMVSVASREPAPESPAPRPLEIDGRIDRGSVGVPTPAGIEASRAELAETEPDAC